METARKYIFIITVHSAGVGKGMSSLQSRTVRVHAESLNGNVYYCVWFKCSSIWGRMKNIPGYNANKK